MRRDREAGTATVEFIWLALLLIIPMVYVLIAAFHVQSAAYGVSAASKSAARAFILAPDAQLGFARAQRAAKVALSDQHVTGASISIECLPNSNSCFQPGSSVRVVVRMKQPLPLTPSALGHQLAPVVVDSSHVEPYGHYREGSS